MPQFDQFSFFNQIIWFFFFFLNFYFFISYYFLPTICYNLKFRKKKINFNTQVQNQIHLEKQTIILFFNVIYQNLYSNFQLFINKKENNYLSNQTNKIIKQPLINLIFMNQIINILKKKYLLSNKILLNI